MHELILLLSGQTLIDVMEDLCCARPLPNKYYTVRPVYPTASVRGIIAGLTGHDHRPGHPTQVIVHVELKLFRKKKHL